MNHSQALRLALDALGKFSIGYHVDAVELNDLIATLEAALEQPKEVALFTKYGPPTMRDRDFWSAGYAAATARAIEAALKERNA